MPERVEYRGVTYTRSDGRPYFAAPRGQLGESFLHRQVYVDHYGPIPPGWLVHHADHDKSNNAPDNLVALTPKEHAAEHRRDTFWSSDEWREHLSAAREKAAEWHRSEEGRAWHREHGRRSWEGRERLPARPCENCGVEFRPFLDRARFCSRACISAERRRRVRVVAVCVECGAEFDTPEHSRQRTCSRSCGGKLGVRRRRAGK